MTMRIKDCICGYLAQFLTLISTQKLSNYEDGDNTSRSRIFLRIVKKID